MWDPQVFVWSVKFSPRFHCQDVVIFNAKFELLWSVQLIYLRLDVRLKYPLRSFGKRRIAYWCLFYHFGIDSNLLKFHYFPFISNPFFFFLLFLSFLSWRCRNTTIFFNLVFFLKNCYEYCLCVCIFLHVKSTSESSWTPFLLHLRFNFLYRVCRLESSKKKIRNRWIGPKSQKF